MFKALDVYLYGTQAATIQRIRGTLQLRYLPEYAAATEPVPLSVQFPVTPEKYTGEKVEWRRVRDVLALNT